MALAIAHHARGQEIDFAEVLRKELPADMNPTLKRDLLADPAALAHWLATHPERVGESR
jgi:hypothetical protein